MTNTRTCAVCGVKLTGRPESVYCSSACRQKAYRDRTRNVTDKGSTRNVTPGAETIDWSTVTGTAREKAERMGRVIKREIKAEYQSLLKALEDDLKAEKALRFQAEIKATRAESMQRNARRVLDARGGAVFTSAEYKLIWKCVHPDTKNGGGVSEADLAKAFRLVSDAKELLCKEHKRSR